MESSRRGFETSLRRRRVPAKYSVQGKTTARSAKPRRRLSQRQILGGPIAAPCPRQPSRTKRFLAALRLLAIGSNPSRATVTCMFQEKQMKRIQMKRVVAVLLFAGLAFPAYAANVFGEWTRSDGKSRVRFAPCGGAICGVITWLKHAGARPKSERRSSMICIRAAEQPGPEKHSTPRTASVTPAKSRSRASR